MRRISIPWLKSPKNIAFILLLILMTTVSLLLNGRQNSVTNEKVKPIETSEQILHYFYLPSCHDCHEQEEELHKITDGNIKIIYHDVTQRPESAFFSSLAEATETPTTAMGIPAVYFNGSLYIGLTKIETILAEQEVHGKEERSQTIQLPFFGTLQIHSVSLPLLAIIMGLIDGINPCAMWVLLYLIGLVSDLKDRRLMIFIVGAFVLASGILYFLFMSAWLNAFLLAGSIGILKILLGAFAFTTGVFGILELIKTRGAIVCKIGDTKKRKKLMDEMKDLLAKPFSIALVLGIIALAFVVNSIEFLCSAALPAVFTGILTEHTLPLPAYYGYIALYTFFFMLDDLLIFSLAVFAISKTQNTPYAAISRWAGNSIMLLLGALLLFFPKAGFL